MPPDVPDLPTLAARVAEVARRLSALERNRAIDAARGDRIERALGQIQDPGNKDGLTYKVDSLMDIVVQFRGIAKFLKAGISTVAALAGLAALISVVHALWP